METFHSLNESVKFYAIHIENFLSVGSEYVQLNYTTGINVLRGINYDEAKSNGAGKSAILVDALLWCLFGKTLRKLPNANVINDGVKKGCKVAVLFTKGGVKHQITRQIPTKLELKINGEIPDDAPAIDRIQSDINRILCGNYDVFKSIITFHINKTKAFSSSGAEDKRKTWEYILNIIIYRQMGKIINDMKRETDKDLLVNTEKLKACEEALELMKKQKAELETQLANFESKKKSNIAGWKEKIEEEKVLIVVDPTLEEKLKRAKDAENQATAMLDGVTPKLDKAKKLDYKVYGKLENLKGSKIDIQKVGMESKCPTCEQPITKKHIQQCIKVLDKEIANMEEGYTVTQSSVDKLKKQESKVKEMIRKAQDKYKEYKSVKDTNEIHKNNIKTWEYMVKECEDDSNLKKLEESLTKGKKSLTEKGKELKLLIDHVKDLKVSTDDFDLCKTLLSDTGIKEYVISIILPFVNKKLEEYMLRMNTSYTVKFGSDLSETFTKVTGNSKDRKYENFSEGEKKRIDLAMLLTFIDLAQLCGTINSNLLIFDELLDSSADGDGLESFMDILHEKAHNEKLSVWIISHREELENIPIDREVIVARKDDVSYIEKG